MGKGGKGEKPLSAKKQALIGLVEKNGSATPAFKAVLGEIFRKYDKDKDGSLSSSELATFAEESGTCLLYTSPSPRDMRRSRMPSSA